MSDFSYEIGSDNIAIVKWDVPNKKFNVLTLEGIDEIENILDDLFEKNGLKGVIISSNKDNFSAGMDLNVLAHLQDQSKNKEEIFQFVMRAHKFLRKIELGGRDSKTKKTAIPFVWACNGLSAGIATEIGLACHYRIAANIKNTKIGLPEVKLGIIPGAQGTQRLSRVSSVEFALKLATLGNPVGAQEALEAGAIDKISNGELIDDAVSYAEELLKNNAPLKKSHTLSIDPKKYNDSFFNDYRKTISRKTRGMAAPECCIKAIQASVNLPFEEGVKFEREMTIECRDNPQSKALQHVFFAERQAAKVPGLSKDTPLQAIKKVGVIGAGTMGGGISMNFANVGIPVKILEMDQAALDKGLGLSLIHI